MFSALSPATEHLKQLRAGSLRSRDLLEAYLERIDRLNAHINAVVTIDSAGALRQADLADRVARSGGSLGPLHGLPVTVKDGLATAGMRSTGGAAQLAEYVPTEDASVVAALRAAGAIVFGKTNLPTWSGDSQTNSEVFGRTVNPWRASVSPGGSSGGGAAAVAAGLTAIDIGTDMGGSLRIPASHCGVFGHKPSHGVAAARGMLIYPGSERLEPDLAVVGPLGRSASDLALIMRVLGGSRLAAPRRTGDGSRLLDLRRCRIAALIDVPSCPVSREVAAVLMAAVDAAQAAGAVVDWPNAPIDLEAARSISVRLAGAALALDPLQGEPGLDSDPLELAMRMSHREWLILDQERREFARQWDSFMHNYDLVLCPIAATAATPHDDQPQG